MNVALKPLVIKVGGDFMDHPEHALALLQSVKKLQQTSLVVLVHGGGSAVQKLLTDLGHTSKKIDGLRVTPKDQIGYVTGVLAGTANKTLCGYAIEAGLSPVGLSLADGGMTTCEPISEELGSVGTVAPQKSALLECLLSQEFLPIISSIGADTQGKLLNVNADQAATAIAKLLDANLFLLSDVPGVLDANKALITELHPQQAASLIEQQVIRDGMVVKVQAAQATASALGRVVTIASWKQPEALVNIYIDNVGTKIYPISSQQESL